MNKYYVFRLPPDTNNMIHIFNLKKVFANSRTVIYENDKVRCSYDKRAVRVMFFEENFELLEDLRKYFYGETYEKI